MKLDKLLPIEGEDHHNIKGLTVENKTIEIGNGKFQDFIVESTLINCVIRIKCGANHVNIFNSSLIDCVIWPSRQMNNLRFTGLEMVGCTFKGAYSGCRFGNEDENQNSNIRECDFSQAKKFDLCNFLGGSDVESCKFPTWPHIVVTDLPSSKNDWLSLELTDDFRLIQEVICDEDSISNAATIYLPEELEGYEVYRDLLESKSYILIG